MRGAQLVLPRTPSVIEIDVTELILSTEDAVCGRKTRDRTISTEDALRGRNSSDRNRPRLVPESLPTYVFQYIWWEAPKLRGNVARERPWRHGAHRGPPRERPPRCFAHALKN